MSTTAGTTHDYGAFLEALKTPAMAPYAYALRCLTDPRSKAERITAAVEQHIGAFRHLPERAITTALQKRLAWRLRETSLTEPPCDKAIRERVRTILHRSGTSTLETPHTGPGRSQATVIGST
jgi:hypothetical protein